MRLDLEIQRRVTKQNRQIKIRVVDKGETMKRECKQGRLLDCCWWWILQTLDSRTGTPATWMRFDFFAYSHKNLHCIFLAEELALWFLLKEVKPSPDHKMIKLLAFDTCFCYYHNSLKPVVEWPQLSRFPAQKKKRWFTRALLSIEKISVLVVDPVFESKGL